MSRIDLVLRPLRKEITLCQLEMYFSSSLLFIQELAPTNNKDTRPSTLPIARKVKQACLKTTSNEAADEIFSDQTIEKRLDETDGELAILYSIY